MANALIIIDQVANPPGVPGAAREDLDLFGGANPITFTNDDDVGVVSWVWTLIDRPNGSAAALAGAATPAATLNADVRGSYLVRLVTTDAAGNVYQDETVASVVLLNGWRIPAAFETTQFHAARGWAEELDEILRDIAAGVGIVNSLQNSYDDGESIVIDAQGSIDVSRGALAVAGEGALLVQDLNVAPGRTVPLVDVDDDNVVGAGPPATVRISRVAAGMALLVNGDAHVTGKLTVDGLIDPTGLVLAEQAVVPGGAPGAGKGVYWTKNDVPSTPYFTDDAGADHLLAFAAAAVTLQVAYDNGEVVTTDASGALDIIRGAATVIGEGALSITDANASAGRTQVLIDIADTNVVGLATASTVRINRSATGYALEVGGDVGVIWPGVVLAQVGTALLPVYAFAAPFTTTGFFHDNVGSIGVSVAATAVAWFGVAGITLPKTGVAAGAASQAESYHALMAASMWTGAAEVERIWEINAQPSSIVLDEAGGALARLRFTYENVVLLEIGGDSPAGATQGPTFYSRAANGTNNGFDFRIGANFTAANNAFQIVDNNDVAPAALFAVRGDGRLIPGTAGSVLTPTYTWAGDEDSGVYLAAANQVGVSTGNVATAVFATDLVTLTSYADSATGMALRLYHEDPSPDNDDVVGHVDFFGRDAAPALKQYGRVAAIITTQAAGASRGGVRMSSYINGAESTYFQHNPGLCVTDADTYRTSAAAGWFEATTTAHLANVAHTGDLAVSADLAVFTSTNAGAAGQVVQLYQNSANPADNDVVGRISFKGNMDTGVPPAVDWATIEGVAQDVTAATFEGRLRMNANTILFDCGVLSTELLRLQRLVGDVPKIGFFGAAPVVPQTAPTPTAAELKAGLVALGLFV